MSPAPPPPPPKRPYLLRAMHQWMSDSGHTPHVIVDAERGPSEAKARTENHCDAGPDKDRSTIDAKTFPPVSGDLRCEASASWYMPFCS